MKNANSDSVFLEYYTYLSYNWANDIVFIKENYHDHKAVKHRPKFRAEFFPSFEIKRKEKLYSSDFNNLKIFAAEYPEAKLHLLYGGTEEYVEADIQVIPYQKALQNLPNIIGQ